MIAERLYHGVKERRFGGHGMCLSGFEGGQAASDRRKNRPDGINLGIWPAGRGRNHRGRRIDAVRQLKGAEVTRVPARQRQVKTVVAKSLPAPSHAILTPSFQTVLAEAAVTLRTL